MAPGWQVLPRGTAGLGLLSPARAWGLRRARGRGWAGGSLLDDGGQLCAEILAVEPLLKQDVSGVAYVVPARTKSGHPAPHLDVLRAASLRPGSACDWPGPGWPYRADGLLHPVSATLTHTRLSQDPPCGPNMGGLLSTPFP